ncbi:hypothetical protein ACKUB1_00320 [Methanospirillum stamsii]|nr:hypothetical protein [Methanospirillum stamsii]
MIKRVLTFKIPRKIAFAGKSISLTGNNMLFMVVPLPPVFLLFLIVQLF